MGHRRTLWLTAALALVFAACATPRAKSADCTAIINRCLESCTNEPEKIQPRDQVAATGKTMSVPQSACEQRCSNRCK